MAPEHPTPSSPEHVVSISVRNFVAPLEPSGSIDVSFSLRIDEDPMALGARAHARVQKRLAREKTGYLKEVAVDAVLASGNFAFLVRGKIDGYFPSDEGAPPLVEEIKTTFRPSALVRQIEDDPEHVYALQAKMYAWMRWRSTGEHPLLRLRVVSLIDESETLIMLDFQPEAFSAWVDRQLEAHRAAKVADMERARERAELAERLEFPFSDLRSGQALMMEEVEAALEKRERLLLQAPTGLGKSAAILFPALRWALRNHARVFYATPRNSQHAVAEDVVKRLNALGFPVRSVTLRAKEKVCPMSPINCRPTACPRALLYYDRLRETDALATLADQGCAEPDLVASLSDLHALCPFELSLDAALRADVIICDYNYVFAPNSQLQRFFASPEECARNVVLVDEAHNLGARANDWFSPALSRAWLKQIDEQRKKSVSVRSLRTKVRRQILASQKVLEAHAGPTRILEPLEELLFKQERSLTKLLGELVAGGDELPANHPLLELFRGWSEFCNLLRNRGSEHIVTWNHEAGALQITCADSSSFLTQRHRLNAQTIAFSATLKPFEYHMRLGGFSPETTRACEFPSPFPPENRKLLVVPQISTLFRERERQAPKVAEFLERVLPLRQGNYFVFFPSFDFMDKTLAHVRLPDFEVVVQPRAASAAAVNGILQRLHRERGLVVFAVQGGSLSEGVDCPGEALIGAVVVGPPLPQFNLEREEVRKYFDKKYGKGREYAYTYPAMARAVQAAGRVIRTPCDHGLVALLDRRFLLPEYACCMPSDWYSTSVKELVSTSILADVSSFWNAGG